LSWKPELFPQGSGRLWWERGIQQKKRRREDTEDTKELNTKLKTYIQSNQVALQTAVDALRARVAASTAACSSQGAVGGMPLSKQAWVEWMGTHREEFQQRLREVRANSRRVLRSMALFQKRKHCLLT
jgi:hypothetical protein